MSTNNTRAASTVSRGDADVASRASTGGVARASRRVDATTTRTAAPTTTTTAASSTAPAASMTTPSRAVKQLATTATTTPAVARNQPKTAIDARNDNSSRGVHARRSGVTSNVAAFANGHVGAATAVAAAAVSADDDNDDDDDESVFPLQTSTISPAPLSRRHSCVFMRLARIVLSKIAVSCMCCVNDRKPVD